MSRPDKPAAEKNNARELHDTINELEYLIGDTDESGQENDSASGIPVLEDLVDPELYDPDDDPDAVPVMSGPTPTDQTAPVTDAQITELLGHVEDKIAGELDELVDILKDTIKDSILTELKTELKNEFPSSKSSGKD